MSCHTGVYEWADVIATHLPQLTKPQATVLALWSYGMVLARSCALTAVTVLLAALLQAKENTVRQRLREFTYEAAAKRGEQRTELDVASCWRPLLAWVLADWSSPQLALALDPTTLGDRFVVLTVSVLYRGCAIPVAWQVVPANRPGAWRPHWLRLLRLLHRAVPRHLTVLVLADRGLYARWLFRRIVRLGWHPLLRVNAQGTFRPAGTARYQSLRSFVPEPGTAWQGRGTAFQGPDRRLECTLLAYWAVGCEEPWLVLTDLPPDASDVRWYGLRAWIEQGFKIIKRGGWQWQRTRMTDPDRAARLWLAIAVATLWLLQVGGAADAVDDAALPADLPDDLLLPEARPTGKTRRVGRWRLVSIFRRGWVGILVALLRHESLPRGRLVPEPWPMLTIPPRSPPGGLPCCA